MPQKKTGSKSSSSNHNAKIIAAKSRAKEKASRVKNSMRRVTDETDLDADIRFSERQTDPAAFEYQRLCFYLIFLGTFFWATVMTDRTRESHFLAEYVHDLVGVDMFMSIRAKFQYQEWLEYHLFSGLGNVSYRASQLYDPATIVMIGALRMRQIRSKASCEVATEMAGFGKNITMPSVNLSMLPSALPEVKPLNLQCLGATEKTEPLNSSGKPFPLPYLSPSETNEADYGAKWSGLTYSSGGYIFKNTSYLLRAPSTKFTEGGEFYTWAHSRPDASALVESGWMDTEARAMIHDFTLFSPSYGNAYVNVRLLVEVGLDTGVVLPWHHIRMFWMHDPRKFHASLAFEFAYFIMVFILILDEIMQFCQSYSLSETILREKKIEARMQLRLQMLQKAAFQGLFPYRPRVLMMQVAKRLAQVDPERKQHIANLNAIGREIPVLHEKYLAFMKTNRAKSNIYDAEEQAHAIMDLLGRIEQLRLICEKEDALRIPHKSCKQHAVALWIRLRQAFLDYISSWWNVLDVVNLSIFVFTISRRILLLSTSIVLLDRVSALKDEADPWDDSKNPDNFIPMYDIAHSHQIVTFLNAFNSILTWVKLFKFLNWFPNVRILTNTLGMASNPLLWFCIILAVVLFGSGQGFYLAFGLSIREFYTMSESTLTLARMALGDFDYTELSNAHPFLGPLMFWAYIFLMFFVLMSVFIALIAEAYEKAKDRIDREQEMALSRIPTTDRNDVVLRLQHKVQRVMRQMVDENLISTPLEVELRARLDEKFDPLFQQLQADAAIAGHKKKSWFCRCCFRSRKNIEHVQNLLKDVGLPGISLKPERSVWREKPVDVFLDENEDENEAMEECAQLLSSCTGQTSNEVTVIRQPSRMIVTVYGASNIQKPPILGPHPFYYVVAGSGERQILQTKSARAQLVGGGAGAALRATIQDLDRPASVDFGEKLVFDFEFGSNPPEQLFFRIWATDERTATIGGTMEQHDVVVGDGVLLVADARATNKVIAPANENSAWAGVRGKLGAWTREASVQMTCPDLDTCNSELRVGLHWLPADPDPWRGLTNKSTVQLIKQVQASFAEIKESEIEQNIPAAESCRKMMTAMKQKIDVGDGNNASSNDAGKGGDSSKLSTRLEALEMAMREEQRQNAAMSAQMEKLLQTNELIYKMLASNHTTSPKDGPIAPRPPNGGQARGRGAARMNETRAAEPIVRKP